MANIFQFIISLALVVCAVNCSVDEQFSKFVKDYNKNYTQQEFEIRKRIFASNLEKIEKHNKSGKSYKLGVNKYADLSENEFFTFVQLDKNSVIMKEVLMKPRLQSITTETKQENLRKELPASVDLRDEGLINAVQDQGSCGGCWSFSAACSMESQYAKNTGTLLKLSEQQLISCDYYDYGCNGGWMTNTFQYLMDNKPPICTIVEYPYQGFDSKCKHHTCYGTFDVEGYVLVKPNDDTAMMTAVSKTAIAVAVSATYNFQLYHSGVFEDDSCAYGDLNHAVTVVGYGEENGVPYYLVRNSWGESWGENGYIKMKRGTPNSSGTCNLLSNGVYPILGDF